MTSTAWNYAKPVQFPLRVIPITPCCVDWNFLLYTSTVKAWARNILWPAMYTSEASALVRPGACSPLPYPRTAEHHGSLKVSLFVKTAQHPQRITDDHFRVQGRSRDAISRVFSTGGDARYPLGSPHQFLTRSPKRSKHSSAYSTKRCVVLSLCQPPWSSSSSRGRSQW